MNIKKIILYFVDISIIFQSLAVKQYFLQCLLLFSKLIMGHNIGYVTTLP